MSAANPKIVGFHRSPGNTIAQSKAEVYGKELLRIERERGDLANATIVKEARPKSSPLHEEFTWDDTDAAARFREIEAGNLKRAIVVTLRYSDGREVTAPLTIALHVRDERDGAPHGSREPMRVESVVRVLSNADRKAQMVEEALGLYLAMRRRYEMLDTLAGNPLGGIHKAIDAAQQKLALEKAG